MTAAEVVAAVVADAVFYSFDEGGLTLSGGEALMQPEFAAAICQEGHRHALHTALETCAAVPWENIHLVCRHMDHVMVDLKHMDPRRHKEGTGMDNRLILDNILRLRAEFAELPLTIRCPVIPGFNDSESNIRDTARFVGALPRAKLELLSYHRFGEDKYDNLGRPYALRGLMPPDAEHMRHLRSVAGEYSVMV